MGTEGKKRFVEEVVGRGGHRLVEEEMEGIKD